MLSILISIFLGKFRTAARVAATAAKTQEMSQMRCSGKRYPAASVSLLVAVGLAVGGCGSTGNSSAASCLSKSIQSLPGGNLANTRDVASPITSSNVSQLGVAWCVPVESTGATKAAGLANGYATTPVVVNGVVYIQDQESNVMAIRLATGKVLWTHNYNSLNGGPGPIGQGGWPSGYPWGTSRPGLEMPGYPASQRAELGLRSDSDGCRRGPRGGVIRGDAHRRQS